MNVKAYFGLDDYPDPVILQNNSVTEEDMGYQELPADESDLDNVGPCYQDEGRLADVPEIPCVQGGRSSDADSAARSGHVRTGAGMTRWRELADRCRGLPLVGVMEALGGERDGYDKQKWRLGDCAISLGTDDAPHKFFDHRAGKGGGGAIDLVMHVTGRDFQSAVELLASMDGGHDAPVPKARPEKAIPGALDPFQPPPADVRHLPAVMNYLTEVRGLPLALVQEVVDRGRLFADRRRNAVFLCTNGSEVTGAEVRGTGSAAFKGMARGAHRGVGAFMLRCEAPAAAIVVVESAIDALSYRALYPEEHAYIVSAAGVLTEWPLIEDLANWLNRPEIVVAYDNDAPGNRAAEALMASLQAQYFEVRRRAPILKDWNDQIRYENALVEAGPGWPTPEGPALPGDDAWAAESEGACHV